MEGSFERHKGADSSCSWQPVPAPGKASAMPSRHGPSCGTHGACPARSAQQVRSAGALYLLDHCAGELLDSGWQGDVAEGGGVGLAAVGEPVQEIDQCLPGGLAGLVGVEERPAVAGDGVAGGPGSLTIEKLAGVMSGFWAASAAMEAGVGAGVLASLVADGGVGQDGSLQVGALDVADGVGDVGDGAGNAGVAGRTLTVGGRPSGASCLFRPWLPRWGRCWRGSC